MREKGFRVLPCVRAVMAAVAVTALIGGLSLSAAPSARATVVAPAAAAVATVAYPSSVLAAGLPAGTTATAAVGAVGTGSSVVAGGGAVTSAAGATTLTVAGASGGAIAGTVAAGLVVGWSLGDLMVRPFGLSSNDAAAELLSFGPGPSWAPNSDVPVSQPGWTPDGVISTPYGAFTFHIVAPEPVHPVTDGSKVVMTATAPRPNVQGAPGYGLFWKLVCQPGGGGGTQWSWTVGYSSTESTKAVTGKGAATSCNGGVDYVDVWTGSSTPTTVVDRWYPQGHPQRPATPDGNPERIWRTILECSNGTVKTADSVPWRHGDATFPPAPPVPGCGQGYPLSIELWEIVPSMPELNIPVWSWESPIDWADVPVPCWLGDCKLELFRTSQTGPKVNCHEQPEACLDWYRDVNKASEYECKYAGVVVDIEECRVYAPSFNKAVGVGTKNSTGEEIPATEVAPLADPRTGTAVRKPPSEEPGSDPSGTPVADNPGCPPQFTTVNFITGYWVYKGVACALSWAFIPPAGAITAEVTATKTLADTKPPFSLIPAVQPTISAAVTGWSGACTGGPDFDVTADRLTVPCAPPPTPAWTALYWLVGSAIVVVTAFYTWNLAVAALGGGDA